MSKSVRIVPLVYRGIKTKYMITEDGDIYNKDFHKMKNFISKGGYVKCGLKIKGKVKHVYVHVAVWESFMGEIPPKMEVNHIMAIKTDNRLSQLELVTKQGNMDHAKKLGLIPKGEECKMCKHTEKVIRKTCKLLEKGLSQKEIAEKLDLPIYIVNQVANHKIWKHISAEYDVKNKGRHFYTPEEDSKLIELFESGMSYEDIADEMGLKFKSVQSRLFHLGYKKGKQHNYTKEEEKEIMKMYNDGISCDKIAERFGVDISSVYGKIHRLKRR